MSYKEQLQLSDVRHGIATALGQTLFKWDHGFHPKPAGYPYLEFHPPLRGKNGNQLLQVHYRDAASFTRERLQAGTAAILIDPDSQLINPTVGIHRLLNHQGHPVEIPVCLFPLEPLIGQGNEYIATMTRVVLPDFATALYTYYASYPTGEPAFTDGGAGAMAWVKILNRDLTLE